MTDCDPAPTTEDVTVFVCTDCHLLIGGCAEEWVEGDPSPFSGDESILALTSGMASGCAHWEKVWSDWSDHEHDEHVEQCETITFSTQPCPGCGTDLAGTRHAVTVVTI